MSNEHPSEQKCSGARDRMDGRESAFDLLRADENPNAEEYRTGYAAADKAYCDARDAVERGHVEPPSGDDQIVSVDIPLEMYQDLERLAKSCNLTVSEYCSTYIDTLFRNMPMRPPGQQKTPDEPGSN